MKNKMKIIIKNLAIEYQDLGHGPVLLFLHGWQDNLHTFDKITASLSSKYRIVSLDLPGFGKSEIPQKAWNLDSYVDFTADFISKLKIKPYSICGHSFGGRIVIKGIAEKKLHPQKIILIASAGVSKNRKLKNNAIKTIAKIGKLITSIPPLTSFQEKMKQKLYSHIGSNYNNAGALKETFLKIVAEDLSGSAKKITIPALLVWGENDTKTPLIDGQKLSKLIKNSKLNILKNTGHFVHQEKSSEVSKIIKEFL